MSASQLSSVCSPPATPSSTWTILEGRNYPISVWNQVSTQKIFTEWSLLGGWGGRGGGQDRRWTPSIGPRSVSYLNGLHLELNLGGHPSLWGKRKRRRQWWGWKSQLALCQGHQKKSFKNEEKHDRVKFCWNNKEVGDEKKIWGAPIVAQWVKDPSLACAAV